MTKKERITGYHESGLPSGEKGLSQALAEAGLPDVDGLIVLARRLRQARRNEDAARCLARVVELNPRLPGVHNNLGNIYRELLQADRSEHHLLKAIELQPGLPEALNNLGALYAEQGRVEEAIQRFRQAIACRPGYTKAHRNLATTRRHSEYDDEICAMEQLFDRTDATDFDRMQLGFGLGKAFADLGEHERAFRYWEVANRCQRRLSPYDVRRALQFMEVMQQTFDESLLLRAGTRPRNGPVPVFVVGMPRSGTSLTEQILASHSAVFGAGEQELIGRLGEQAASHPAKLGRLDADTWKQLGERYLEQVQGLSNGEPFIVDKLPTNFLYIGMIRMMLPQAKIVHCLRDPMDTGLSCFRNYFMAPGLNFSCDLTDIGTYYHGYSALMAHWERVLPKAVHQLVYERLVSDPETEIRRLLEFCGLPFEERCLSFHRVDRMVATASMVQVRQPIHSGSVGAWRRYEQQLQPLRAALGLHQARFS